MAANIVSYSSNILISFVLTPFLINTLGKETYSFYPMANTIITYISVLSNSMNTVAARFVTVSLIQKKTKEANSYFSSVLASNLIMGAVLLLPMILGIYFLDFFLDIPVNSIGAVKTLFSLVFASTLVNIIAAVFGVATFAKNRIDLRSLRELITAGLRLLLFVLLYKFLPPSIIYVGIVTLFVAVVNILFQIFYTKKLLPEIHIQGKSISWQHTKELLNSSIWNVISNMGNAMLANLTLVLANILYGASVAGIYSIVQTVPQFINGIICMLVGVFYPVVTYKYASNDISGVVLEVQKAQKIIGASACAVIVVFISLSEEFFLLWTPGEDAHLLFVLSAITIMPHMFISCVWILTNLNIAMNKVKIPAIYNMILGGINIISTFLIYRIWQPNMLYIAITSTALQLIWVVILIPQYSSYLLHVKWNTFYGAVVRALICTIPTVGLIFLLKQFFVLDTWIKFIFFGCVMGVFSLLIFIVGMTGIKAPKEIYHIIHS